MLKFVSSNTVAKVVLWSAFTGLLMPVSVSADLLEEVIVTAKKREENLQDVSVSLTAFTADTMRDIGLKNSNDLSMLLPNVEIASVAGNQMAKTHIRGSGSVDFAPNSQTTVGVYVDEVYLVNIFQHTVQLFDLERIEVLRGPQGTLYGRNATAGAINYITAKPTQELSGYAKASYGRYDAVQLEGAVSGGITDNLAGRVAIVYNNDNGWMDARTNLPGTVAGDELNNTDSYAWRALLTWMPQDNVEILFNVHGSQDHSNGFTYQNTGAVDPVTFGGCDATVRDDCVDFFSYQDPDGIEERGDPTEVDSDFHGKADYETIGTNLRIDWELENFTVTSITAYDKFQRKQEEDADASPATVSHNFFRHATDGWAQELRLTSTTDGPWDWLLGFYYAEDELDSHNLYNFFGFLTFQDFDQEQSSIAGYANFGYVVNNQFKVYVGLRYTKDEVELNHRSDLFDPPPPVGFGFGLGPFSRSAGKESYEDVSWKVGIDYTPNDNWLWYAHIGTGYKSGGINVGFGDPGEFKIYKDEKILAYEVGFKSTLWDGKARLNVTGFIYDYEDLQVFDQSTGAFGNLVAVIGNANQADYYGAEVELLLNPTKGLDLMFGVSHLNTEFKDFLRPLTGADLKGNENVFSPEWKLSGIARYEWAVPGVFEGRMAASFHWSWTDQVWQTVENLSDSRAKKHWLSGGRLSWFSTDEAIEVALWAQNLNNAKYRIQTFDFRSVGFITSVPNRPRSYGIEVVYNW